MTKKIRAKKSKDKEYKITNGFREFSKMKTVEIKAKIADKKEKRSQARSIILIDPLAQTEHMISNWYYTNKPTIDQGIQLFSAMNSQIISFDHFNGTATFLLNNGQMWAAKYTPIGYYQPTAIEPFWIWSFSGSMFNNIPVLSQRIHKFYKKLRKLGNVYGLLNGDILLLGNDSVTLSNNLVSIFATSYYAVGPIGQFTVSLSEDSYRSVGIDPNFYGMTGYNLVTKMWRIN
jgi:hypothetical protein